MALMDPTEGRFGRVFRWVLFGAIGLGGLWYFALTDWEGFKAAFWYWAIGVAGLVLIRAMIVDPILGEIRALKDSIESIRRRLS